MGCNPRYRRSGRGDAVAGWGGGGRKGRQAPRAHPGGHARISRRFPPPRLRQPACPQGRGDQAARDRLFRQLQPLYRQGRFREPRLRRRYPDDVAARGDLGRVRAGRRDRRGAERPFLGDLQPPTGGALPRRQAGDGRRRHLQLQRAPREGTALLPLLLPQYRQGGTARPAPGEVPLHRAAQPRASADHRPASGSAQTLLGRPRLRPDDAGAAARQRTLPDLTFRARAVRRIRAGEGLLGASGCRSISA